MASGKEEREGEENVLPEDRRSEPFRPETGSAATLWLTEEAWTLSMWRGEVDAPDRLRIDGRDGSVHELRLERAVGSSRPVKLGRAPQVGDESNDLVFPDVASRLATTFQFDGVRWWMTRREECSVPCEVGGRVLGKGERASLVHGTLVVVGGMRAVFADRRYVTFSAPADAVDSATGLLGRVGMELEIGVVLRRKGDKARPTLILAQPPVPDELGPLSERGRQEAAGKLALLFHRAMPMVPVGVLHNTACALLQSEADADKLAPLVGPEDAVGIWPLRGNGGTAIRELELGIAAVSLRRSSDGVGLMRVEAPAEVDSVETFLESTRSDKRTTMLFGIEDQHSLDSIGRHILPGLEEELASIIKVASGLSALVSPVARGVIGASVPRKLDSGSIGQAVASEWKGRPPILDGRAELPRSLSWEIPPATLPVLERATELSHECADPSGVLSALSSGLPYPIAGRVAALSTARSGVERVKMLFDVLEGTWRFLAAIFCAGFFSGGASAHEPAVAAMTEFLKRNQTRDGYALGVWRELARHAALGLSARQDPIAVMAKDVLGVRLSENQTFETLSNLLQAERNSFAHGQYTEANAESDRVAFEQMTRTLLRALRPLLGWTLVTVERTEPDMYGEQQTVEFIDHTGPNTAGVRRKIGLVSGVRLANVTYLAKWREGEVVPLEPFLRRLPLGERFDLFWMDHLPRSGPCVMSGVVGGSSTKSSCDTKRLPPLLRRVLGVP